jgi:hypothetical protein
VGGDDWGVAWDVLVNGQLLSHAIASMSDVTS